MNHFDEERKLHQVHMTSIALLIYTLAMGNVKTYTSYAERDKEIHHCEIFCCRNCERLSVKCKNKVDEKKKLRKNNSKTIATIIVFEIGNKSTALQLELIAQFTDQIEHLYYYDY